MSRPTRFDVTIQAQNSRPAGGRGATAGAPWAMILITHDLGGGWRGLNRRKSAVMYAGRVVRSAHRRRRCSRKSDALHPSIAGALPRIDAAPHTPLPAISGRPPDPRPGRLKGLLVLAALAAMAGPTRCQQRKKPDRWKAGDASKNQYACFHPIESPRGCPAA